LPGWNCWKKASEDADPGSKKDSKVGSSLQVVKLTAELEICQKMICPLLSIGWREAHDVRLTANQRVKKDRITGGHYSLRPRVRPLPGRLALCMANSYTYRLDTPQPFEITTLETCENDVHLRGGRFG
jgi:hypothetical protein